MSKQELIDWAVKRGWKPDGHGHYQWHQNEAKSYRLKLSTTSARYEVKTKGSKIGWTRIRSGYYSKLYITPEGKLGGMSR